MARSYTKARMYMIHGYGEGEWQDLYGTWYKGTFVLGKRTGSGEVQLSNGHFYKGDFLMGNIMEKVS